MANNNFSTAITNQDDSAGLQSQVQSSLDQHAAILIRGGNTKPFYGRAPAKTSNILELRNHTGVIDYDPTELAITVRAGTLLSDLEALLASQNQMLPFEPPMFGKNSTIGGVIAAGIAGPRRVATGSIRDAVLGVEMINGQGKIVHFGGQVMKNVAGYDMSRLMVRSMGTLGVILSVSLRLLPKPEQEMTLVFSCAEAASLDHYKQWRRAHLPVTATMWHQDNFYVRLSGTEITLNAAIPYFEALSPKRLEDDQGFWASIRNHQYEFFRECDKPVWRLSMPMSAPTLARFEGELLTEWGGAQRWISSNVPANIIRSVAGKYGGHATLFYGRKLLPEVPPFPVLAPELLALHKSLKCKLDPQSIFNLGRMYRGL